MNNDLQMHDLVALLEDQHVNHFETNQPLVLRRGQIGTIVMTYGGDMFEIEFADPHGRAYAVLPIPAARLIRLHELPELAAA
jgi:hypothetical protein